MDNVKKELIELMVRSGVLIFGDFTTKSGRKTPYFVNTGNFKTGAQLDKLGALYAAKINQVVGDEFDMLFGPAYKGIPLACAAAIHLSGEFGIDKPYCFNRKEEKDHGEGGAIVGYAPKDRDRVVITEDVITAGTAVRETIDLFKTVAAVEFKAIIISVDRREKGTGDKSALDEIEQNFGIKVHPIVTVYDIIEYLYNNPVDGKIYIDDNIKSMMEQYLGVYGV